MSFAWAPAQTQRLKVFENTQKKMCKKNQLDFVCKEVTAVGLVGHADHPWAIATTGGEAKTRLPTPQEEGMPRQTRLPAS